MASAMKDEGLRRQLLLGTVVKDDPLPKGAAPLEDGAVAKEGRGSVAKEGRGSVAKAGRGSVSKEGRGSV